MIFVLLLKGQFYEILYSFSTCNDIESTLFEKESPFQRFFSLLNDISFLLKEFFQSSLV
jgi:hypothetical protein